MPPHNIPTLRIRGIDHPVTEFDPPRDYEERPRFARRMAGEQIARAVRDPDAAWTNDNRLYASFRKPSIGERVVLCIRENAVAAGFGFIAGLFVTVGLAQVIAWVAF